MSPNLVPASARAKADIRLPAGLSLDVVEAALRDGLRRLEGITWRIIQAYPPTYTAPEEEIVRRTVAAAAEVLGEAPVVNMRVGASDARLYRMAGIPSVVFGCTPFNMGGPDEHVFIDDVTAVAQVHALAAFDFLAARGMG